MAPRFATSARRFLATANHPPQEATRAVPPIPRQAPPRTTGSGGSGSGGGASNGPLWRLVAAALGLTVVYGVVDYMWVRSGGKARVASRVGYPLDVLDLLREAREANQLGLEQKERFDATVRRAREQRRKQEERDDDDDDKPEQPHNEAAVLTSDDDALALLSSITPSLLESERLYRQVLTRLNFRGLDLLQLHEWVAEGTPTPAMRAVNASVDAGTRRRVQQQIDGVLDGGPAGVDRRILPYTLNALACNLQLQAEMLRDQDQMNSHSHSARPSPSSAAHRRFIASETLYLQSITLYRHHFQNDRRPYAISVLEQLGTLYASMGDSLQAEGVFMKCLDLLAAAKRSLPTRKEGSTPAQGETPEMSALTESSLPYSYSNSASTLAEKMALLYRTRGEYDRSVAWLQDALREWDLFSTQLRQPGAPLVSAGANSGPTAYDLAILPLPRAMHLLTALSADLYSAHAIEPSYQTALQSLQVLERIVQLHVAAQAAATAQLNKSAPKSTAAQSAAPSSPLTHSHFLTPDWTAQLTRFLRAQAASSAVDTPLHEEAAAAYYNMAQLLKARQQPNDARLCMEQAKAAMRSAAPAPQAR